MNKKLISLAASSVIVLSQFSGIAAPVLAEGDDPAPEENPSGLNSTLPDGDTDTGSEDTDNSGEGEGSEAAPGNTDEDSISLDTMNESGEPSGPAAKAEYPAPTKEFIAEHTHIELMYKPDKQFVTIGYLPMNPDTITSIQESSTHNNLVYWAVEYDQKAYLKPGYALDEQMGSPLLYVVYDLNTGQWRDSYTTPIYLSKIPDDFNSDLKLPEKPSVSEIVSLFPVTLYYIDGDSFVDEGQTPLKPGSILSISDPVYGELNIPQVTVKIDYLQYIPEGKYPYILKPITSRATLVPVNHTDVTISYDSINHCWMPPYVYGVFYTDEKPEDYAELPDYQELLKISAGGTIVSGNQKTGFALKEGAYDLVGPIPTYPNPNARSSSDITWIAYLYIENYLNAYTSQPVNKAASNLSAKMVFNPDTKVWEWDGAPLSIVLDGDTPQTPGNPNNPGGSDNGNQGGQDNNGSNQNPGGSNNGSGSGSQKTDGKKTGTSSGSPKTSAASGALSFVLSGITAALGMVSLRKIRRDED